MSVLHIITSHFDSETFLSVLLKRHRIYVSFFAQTRSMPCRYSSHQLSPPLYQATRTYLLSECQQLTSLYLKFQSNGMIRFNILSSCVIIKVQQLVPLFTKLFQLFWTTAISASTCFSLNFCLSALIFFFFRFLS